MPPTPEYSGNNVESDQQCMKNECKSILSVLKSYRRAKDFRKRVCWFVGWWFGFVLLRFILGFERSLEKDLKRLMLKLIQKSIYISMNNLWNSKRKHAFRQALGKFYRLGTPKGRQSFYRSVISSKLWNITSKIHQTFIPNPSKINKQLLYFWQCLGTL